MAASDGDMKKLAEEIVKKVSKSARKSSKESSTVEAKEIAQLLNAITPIFQRESMLLELSAPIYVCGDVHGQVHDVVRLFDMNKWPPESSYLFLGDYVDRGPQNTDTIVLMFAIKLLNTNTFFLLRGNHETKAVNSVYGFKDELVKRFPPKPGDPIDGKALWTVFNQVFSEMPLAALIDKRILCMHGGLSEDLTNFDQIRQIKRPLKKLPEKGIEVDLLWADPDKDTQGFKTSKRGVSCLFGPDAVVKKCEELGIDLVARAHQVAHDGYEFMTEHLVTLFSAPDYCNQFDNHGGVMFVPTSGACKMRVLPSKLRAVTKHKEKEKTKPA